ncbi:MAG: XRE family transcriptional regulator [Pseudomonadota bacterium]
MTVSLAGPHARNLRRAKSLTLDDLAAQSGVSKGHLSRFERGEKSLSISTLMRVAAALDTSVGRLLGEVVDPDDIRHVRAVDQGVLDADQDAGGYKFAMLSDGQRQHGHNTFLVHLDQKTRKAADAYHAGTELILVLEGTVRLVMADRVIDLALGDYVEFPGTVHHTLSAVTDKARCLIVVVPDQS